MKRLTNEQILKLVGDPQDLDIVRAICQAQLDQDKADCASCKRQIVQEIFEEIDIDKLALEYFDMVIDGYSAKNQREYIRKHNLGKFSDYIKSQTVQEKK